MCNPNSGFQGVFGETSDADKAGVFANPLKGRGKRKGKGREGEGDMWLFYWIFLHLP